MVTLKGSDICLNFFPSIACSMNVVFFQEFRNTSTLKTLRDEIVENVAQKLQVSLL